MDFFVFNYAQWLKEFRQALADGPEAVAKLAAQLKYKQGLYVRPGYRDRFRGEPERMAEALRRAQDALVDMFATEVSDELADATGCVEFKVEAYPGIYELRASGPTGFVRLTNGTIWRVTTSPSGRVIEEVPASGDIA